MADSGGSAIPMCQRPAGCIAEDILSDGELQAFTSRYRIARKVFDVNQIDALLMEELRNLGVLEDPELLRDLEIIYLEGSAKEKQREAFRTKQYRR
jgi:hypothetical protein